jgi:hypothetical protein
VEGEEQEKMTLQYSVAVRNARLDAIETTIGTSPILEIRSGPPPANCAAPDQGTVLATLNLPSDWMAPAANGVKVMAGTWQDLSADATGQAGHFRIKDSTGTVCHIQGTITDTNGDGDMKVDNTSFAQGQQFTITAFTLQAGNA